MDLLRSWRLRRDGVDIRVAYRQQRLIAALAIRGPTIRGFLAGLLWPDHPNSKALESVRASVHLISRQAPSLILNEGQKLSLDSRVTVDLHQVNALTRALSQGCHRATLSTLGELRDAELLPGWYEDWVVFEQTRLRQDRLHALIATSRQLLDQGNFLDATAAARAAVEIEPLYETAVRALFAAELQQDNPAGAVHCYRTYRTRLQEDMGVQPSNSFRELVERMIQSHYRVGQEDLDRVLERRL